jgi:LPS-assembly protein
MDNPFYKPTPGDRPCAASSEIQFLPMRLPKHDSNRLAPASGQPRHGFGAWVLVAGVLIHVQVAAQPLAEPALKSSRLLSDVIPAAQRSTLPTFVSGERISSRTDLETVIEGKAVLRRGDIVIRADRLEYFQPDDLAQARGNVSINRAGDVYEGPALDLKLESFEGFFLNPRYRFLKNEGHGEAERVDFIDKDRALIRNATFTTCRRLPGPSWMPDWILQAASISIDNEEEVGQAEGALLSFKGVPLLPIPAISFPLSNRRKSGFLPPSVGVDNVNGVEVSLPYYWNIAPNRDATLFPAVMTKRGVDLAGEFRYLETAYAGQLRANFMPGDKLRNMNRWGVAYSHNGTLDTGLISGLGALGINLSINRVSDDNYWRDFTRVNPWLTQRLLANDLSLSWASGYLSANLRMLKWQTLQDVASPIVPPYDRMPQVALRYARSNMAVSTTRWISTPPQFQADRLLTGQPNGRRTFAVAQWSRPWVSPAGFITPKLQLHATNYQFNGPLANGATSASRVVPTFSLDSGVVFERDASYFGRAFRQTLEPRAFYVHTPFRNQALLPNYDSGSNDFNFASIYTENAFLGNDRIADSDLLTLGLSTRLLDPDTGAEAARFGIAQRVRFKDQRVTLPGGAAVSKGSAMCWWAPASTSIRAGLSTPPCSSMRIPGARSARPWRALQPGQLPGHQCRLPAAARVQRAARHRMAMADQRPVGRPGRGSRAPAAVRVKGRWYSVGRINFSLREGKLVDSVIGLEYDGGCWLGRVVLERLQTGASSANRRIMFQLEFVGFSRLGANPLQTLKQNIPRYQFLRETTTSPGRFSNYE